MMSKIALIGAASLLAISVASAQNAPPPGNVNPGSKSSGAEQTGAPNQPRSTGERPGTTGAAPMGSQSGGSQMRQDSAPQMQQESSPSSTSGGAIGTPKQGSEK